VFDQFIDNTNAATAMHIIHRAIDGNFR
jgi:hypothetical protein